MTDPVEKRFAEFARTYKNERYKLWHLVGQNFGGGFRKFFVPFRDWDESHVIGAEVDTTTSSLCEIRSKFNLSNEIEVMRLRVISLAAKKRAEVMSAKSDFYPVYSALLGVCLAVLAIYAPSEAVQMMAAGGVVFFVATSAVIRMTTREQVAYLKELAHILDHALDHRDAEIGERPPND